jgi:hypothetical protein
MYYNEKHSETSCTLHTQPISKASEFFKHEKHITILVWSLEVKILFEDPGIDDWRVLKDLQKMGRENVE